MTIESLCSIIGGEIVQKGTSEEVFRATVYPENVEEEDLCFVESPENAEAAVAKGAGVLVMQEDIRSSANTSVTLIHVPDLKKAAFALVGYVVSEEDASFELLTEKQMSFLKMILVQKNNIVILPEDWRKAFELILDSSKRLFVGTDAEMLAAIRPGKKTFAQKASGHIVSADSLFRSTFKIEKYTHSYPHCWRTDKPIIYYPWELGYGIRNKTTDVKTNGYGYSELEQGIELTWKWIEHQ